MKKALSHLLFSMVIPWGLELPDSSVKSQKGDNSNSKVFIGAFRIKYLFHTTDLRQMYHIKGVIFKYKLKITPLLYISCHMCLSVINECKTRLFLCRYYRKVSVDAMPLFLFR